MEIHLRPQSNLFTHITNFFQAFTDYDENFNTFIMPLYQLKKELNNHYVTMEPIQLIFEYYDHCNQIQQAEVLAEIISPVQEHRTVEVRLCHNRQILKLSLEQILTTSANVA